MDLNALGFDIPLGLQGKFYFEFIIKFNHEKEGREVSYSGTVEHINRLLSSLYYIAGLNGETINIVNPKLQNSLTEEFLVNKNT